MQNQPRPTRCINDFEDVAREPVLGLIEYLNWRKQYEKSDKSGQLGFLFCAAFDVDSPIRDIDDDITADSLICSSYTYDDLVADES